jgi:chromosome segregation ATPase
MNENDLKELINRLASAAEAMERTVTAVHAQHDELSAKIDRIVAAVDESAARHELEARLADLERANTELKAQLEHRPVERKTLPPLVTALLSKNGIEDVHAHIDATLLDKMLGSLAVDQRIAVKAQMAEAGIIE